jgi:pilus assembly protein CpaE
MAGNPRILVVDQDFEARAELQKGLVRASFIVVGGVGYGAEALSLAAELKPNVILVGIEEPPARALQTIESLTELLPDSPIVAYSSQTDAESARRAVVSGARDYLTKPLKIPEMIKAVEIALSQQERRRALLSGEPDFSPKSAGMVIAVFGAKGGIGKTTVATNLATAFVKINAGNSVLVDVDTVFGDAAMMLDVPVEMSLVDTAARIDDLDRESMANCLVRHHSGLAVLPAPFEPTDWRNVNTEAVDKVLRLLAQTHDFVVVDCPATFTDLVAVALEQATVVLLLTSLDITSIKDTTIAFKLLSGGIQNEDKIKLVVNHATNVHSIREEDVGKVLRREVFWSVPFEEEISASAEVGTPVVIDRPGCGFSETIRGMAAVLAGVETSHGTNGRRTESVPGMFMRLFKR